MKIYIIILEDRHIDVEVYPFRNKAAAIDQARKWAREYAGHFDLEEEQIADWLYYARYSSEGDCIRVVEKDLGDAPMFARVEGYSTEGDCNCVVEKDLAD